MIPTKLQKLGVRIDPRVIPGGVETIPGTIAVIPWWTMMQFTYPTGKPISLSAEQYSQTVTQSDADELPVWTPPYFTGTVFMSEEEIIALPSADGFFGELFAALDAKLALQKAPMPPAESIP